MPSSKHAVRVDTSKHYYHFNSITTHILVRRTRYEPIAPILVAEQGSEPHTELRSARLISADDALAILNENTHYPLPIAIQSIEELQDLSMGRLELVIPADIATEHERLKRWIQPYETIKPSRTRELMHEALERRKKEYQTSVENNPNEAG